MFIKQKFKKMEINNLLQHKIENSKPSPNFFDSRKYSKESG
jgi:hypothetical protein